MSVQTDHNFIWTLTFLIADGAVFVCLFVCLRDLLTRRWFRFEDFNAAFRGLLCLSLELWFQRSSQGTSADSGEADVAANRTHTLATC